MPAIRSLDASQARNPILGDGSDPRLGELTPREREVLELIAQGEAGAG